MRELRVARRYAQALMDVAEETRRIDAVSADLSMINRLFEQSKEFAAFLRSPVIKGERKQRILDELFRPKIGSDTMQFLRMLAEKGREELLPQAVAEFFLLRDQRQGVLGVDVSAAGELTKEQVVRIEERLNAYTHKRVRISMSVDQALIGGFVARVGDTVFDGSLKRQLELLRQRFAEEP